MKRPKVAHAEVEACIGYVFDDKTLLDRALTHISAAKSSEGRLGSYQRLEFLGDRVLGLAIASMLMEEFPKSAEGELSRRLAELVRAEACAEVAEAMQVAPFIRLGPGEAHSGGRKKVAILSDICESVIGAVYVDGGYGPARELVERFWRPRMLDPVRPLRDPKTALQEWAQGRGLPPPCYREVKRSGPDHSPLFRVAVAVDGIGEAEGEGGSKRVAEQAAATELLTREGLAAGDDE